MKMAKKKVLLLMVLAAALSAGCVKCECPCCVPQRIETMEELQAQWKAEGPQDLSGIDWSQMFVTNFPKWDESWIMDFPEKSFLRDYGR